jgi:hypothetical protein
VLEQLRNVPKFAKEDLEVARKIKVPNVIFAELRKLHYKVPGTSNTLPLISIVQTYIPSMFRKYQKILSHAT